MTCVCAVVVSSEKVVQEMSAVWKTDVLMKDLLRVMRVHVMTQYKHYQLYTHNMIAVMKCLARVTKNSKAKEYEYIQTTHMVGNDSCTVLDVLLKPMQYLVNMNKIFNDLDCMLLDNDDTNYIGEIKRYLTQVFNKIQSKLDLMSDIIDEIVKRYENRCQKKISDGKKWLKIKEKFNNIFTTAVVTPCSFTVKLYLNYYFPSEQQFEEYLNAAGKNNKCIVLRKFNAK
ncbi:Hypothetical protein CINCED_3A020094 [Cinara cedri]|uniref:Uncharacterized protein n=1 Tax=Cinara cedri TaxID=506608 RepID=A0A5E4NIR3_9HEMI|nr:Hypothetical protein CINCED_3A020094 [Cinara cedri]